MPIALVAPPSSYVPHKAVIVSNRGRVPADIRMFDPDGRFAGLLPLLKAQEMEGRKAVKITWQGRRTYCRVLLRLEDFDDAKRSSQASHYKEELTSGVVVQLKRPHPDTSSGQKWDEHLTFAELRDGEYESQETKRLKKERRKERIRKILDRRQGSQGPR